MADDGRGEPLGSDGLNAARALILQGYYGLRRTRGPDAIGTSDILAWIAAHEPAATLPSAALIQMTLVAADVAHRAPGRPRNRPADPPFCAVRPQPPRSRSRR